jgi:hypothetical protein
MNNTFTKRLFILCAFCTMFFCAREYNPFTDYSNAALCITYQSFKNSDTLGIFGTETLSAVILVKELVDSCVIQSSNNRLWHASDSAVRKTDFLHEPFQFYFSFSDTGRHSVRMTTYRSNARTLADSITFYVKSPLRQAALSCFFGDSIVLRTPPVKDRDVNYFWSLSPGTMYVAVMQHESGVLFDRAFRKRVRVGVRRFPCFPAGQFRIYRPRYLETGHYLRQ